MVDGVKGTKSASEAVSVIRTEVAETDYVSVICEQLVMRNGYSVHRGFKLTILLFPHESESNATPHQKNNSIESIYCVERYKFYRYRWRA